MTAPQAAPPLPIRRGMDVYSAYQNQYIGTVVKVWQASAPVLSAVERGATPEQTQAGSYASSPGATIPDEQGGALWSHTGVGRPFLGEDLGPFPTRAAGNTGPHHQAAGQHYATQPRGDREPGVVRFAVLPIQPGRFNPFARKLYIPTTAVLSISMERIILNVQQDHIPQAWYRKPR